LRSKTEAAPRHQTRCSRISELLATGYDVAGADSPWNNRQLLNSSRRIWLILLRLTPCFSATSLVEHPLRQIFGDLPNAARERLEPLASIQPNRDLIGDSPSYVIDELIDPRCGLDLDALTDLGVTAEWFLAIHAACGRAPTP
jgi:hypothetical protein